MSFTMALILALGIPTVTGFLLLKVGFVTYVRLLRPAVPLPLEKHPL
ncbi:MAG: hypothetical protein V3W31_10195 [Thermodesulfobacteriota bacterium]